MSSDFDKPGLDDEYTVVLPDIRANQQTLATMFNTGAAFNTPLNAVQFLGGKFALFNGASFDITAVAVGGGGTGATNASDARDNLSLSSISEANALYLKVLSNGSDINSASTFRTNISVPSNSEAALNTDNLSNLASASTSFNNIKQAATEAATGVVEVATTAESESGAPNKFPDAAGVKSSINANTAAAVAAIGANSVGSYAMLRNTGTASVDEGVSVVSDLSNLFFATSSGADGSNFAVGTWRCMGFVKANGTSEERTTLWVRTD